MLNVPRLIVRNSVFKPKVHDRLLSFIRSLINSQAPYVDLGRALTNLFWSESDRVAKIQERIILSIFCSSGVRGVGVVVVTPLVVP